MTSTKSLAIQLFDLDENLACKCNGNHEVCLNCRVCRALQPNQLATDFDNLAQYIDHTALKAETTNNDIEKLCNEADQLATKSVCVNPLYVKKASSLLKKALTCTVVGFPLSNSLSSTIVDETLRAIKDGATEIDMVLKVGWLKDKRYDDIVKEISLVSQACEQNGAILKVIFENCLLTKEEIAIASLLSKKAGAEFVKTSTGFNKSGAEVEDVAIMRGVVGPYYGVKAAGGIRDKETAISMLKAGANRIGASATIKIVKG